MELLLHQWGDWPELYRNTDETEATEIVIIDSQMNYRGKLDTYGSPKEIISHIHEAIESVEGKGLMIGPGCVVAQDCPEENLRAVRQAVE